MKNALSQPELDRLRELCAADVLLAFDFDGTLAPIVDDAAQAFMQPATRELMWQLTQRYPVIVITGRSQPDALKRVRGVGVLEVVGNHGIEPCHTADGYTEQVQSWRLSLEARLAALPGVWIEDKIFSLAVHYRKAEDQAAAHAAILDAAKGFEDARIMGGKLVVNILPRGSVDKGKALLREQERLHCSCAIYVGDDETDEDVFALAQRERLLGIRIGAKANSAASHFIPDQASIDQLLQVLIDLRGETDHGRSHDRCDPLRD